MKTTLVFEQLPDGRTWLQTRIERTEFGAPDQLSGFVEKITTRTEEVSVDALPSGVKELYHKLSVCKVTLEFP